MSEIIDQKKEEISLHKENIRKLENQIKQEEKLKAKKQSLCNICNKGQTMDNEVLGQVAKEVFLWKDIIILLSQWGIITFDQFDRSIPMTFKTASVADILCLFIKDKTQLEKGDN